MSYREEGDLVILSMSREDYKSIMELLSYGIPGNEAFLSKEELDLRDRLNSGNPNYTPYQVEK